LCCNKKRLAAAADVASRGRICLESRPSVVWTAAAPTGAGQSRLRCVSPSQVKPWVGEEAVSCSRHGRSRTGLPRDMLAAFCPSQSRQQQTIKQGHQASISASPTALFVTNRKLTRHARAEEYKQGSGIPPTSDHGWTHIKKQSNLHFKTSSTTHISSQC
jgi:hypothetical protein